MGRWMFKWMTGHENDRDEGRDKKTKSKKVKGERSNARSENKEEGVLRKREER